MDFECFGVGKKPSDEEIQKMIVILEHAKKSYNAFRHVIKETEEAELRVATRAARIVDLLMSDDGNTNNLAETAFVLMALIHYFSLIGANFFIKENIEELGVLTKSDHMLAIIQCVCMGARDLCDLTNERQNITLDDLIPNLNPQAKENKDLQTPLDDYLQ